MKYGKLDQTVDDDTYPDEVQPPVVLPVFCPTCGGKSGYRACIFCGGTGWWPEGKARPPQEKVPDPHVRGDDG